MLKRNKMLQNYHPYQEALHTLLYNYTDGLTAVEIADKLGISDAKCARLLKIEQMHDSIDADPFTGTLIFKSKRTTKPVYCLKKSLKIARKNEVLLGIKIGLNMLSLAMFSCTIISITLNISINLVYNNKEKIKPELKLGNNIQPNTDDPIKQRVDAEIAAKKRMEIENEINDLSNRIANIEFIAVRSGCSKYWNKSQTCYIEGRLLNEEAFNREIAEMKLIISQQKERLSLYQGR